MRSSYPTRAEAGEGHVRFDDLELLSHLARDLASTLALESSWSDFAKDVGNLISFDRIVLALLDPDRKVLRNEIQSGLAVPGLATNVDVPLEGSIGGEVLATGEPIVDNSIGQDFVERFPESDPLLTAGVRSVMAFPLLSGGSVMGVLHIQSRRRDAFDDRDVAIGRAIAALAGGRFWALAVINRLETRVYDLSQAGAERQILTDIAAIVSSSLDISDVYIQFCERVRQLIPWDRIVIQTLNADRTMLTDRFSAGVGPRDPGSTMALDGTLAADVIEQRRTLRVAASDRAELAEVVAKYPALKRSADLGQRSGMVSPLISGDEVIGVLQISCGEPNVYTEKHQQFADQIAVSVASAISNADLHAEVKRAADQREILAARDARASEIERRATERAAFVSQLSHELKTPLTSIGLFTELLKRRASRQPDEKSDGHINGILRNVRRMERLIEDLLDVTAMETGQLSLKKSTFDVAEVLREVVEDFMPYAVLRRQELQLEPADAGSVDVVADRERFAQVVSILVDNACKYAGEGASITLRLTQPEGTVRLEVEDDGPGLPEEDTEKIFGRFYRGEGSSQSAPGTGIGLHMARTIMQAHGGSIHADRGRQMGARFIVELPA